jgi:hypothetical protein
MKAFATDAIFVVVVIGLMIGAALLLYWKWVSLQPGIADEVHCRIKLQSYCNELLAGKQPSWNDLEPKTGCEKFNVYEPTKQQCESLFPT